MGFVQVYSGVPKYVFTQSTAPSGEGEVEGSLWYDTTNNWLETYTGSAWTKVSTSDGGMNTTLIPFKPETVTQGTWAHAIETACALNIQLSNSASMNINDEIIFTTYLPPGTYTLQLICMKSTNMGICKVYEDANLLATFDMYAGVQSNFEVMEETSVVISTGGVKDIKFLIDSKHASSSAYRMVFQGLVFMRTS